LHIVQIGERARRALVRSGGEAAPLVEFVEGPYFSAAGVMIWVGARLPAMHPRAVITSHAQPGGVALRFEDLPAQGWTPRVALLDKAASAGIVENVRQLCGALLAADAPRGFGTLLARANPEFPLDLAVARVQALARAYRRDEPDAVQSASTALLGFGTGLTPSGDDLAGAALFGRRLISPLRHAWSHVAEALTREAEERSHAVSAALFSDLVRGQSFAPLHAIAEALAANDHAAALAPARELTAIGHSSGWDMFTGLVIGLTGRCSGR
jgi:hypothetical protein